MQEKEIYPPEGSSPQEANINHPEKKKVQYEKHKKMIGARI